MGENIRRPLLQRVDQYGSSDVLWVLLCIANQTGVDITTAFQKSMDKKTKRDNKRHINNPKLKDHGRE